MSVGLVFLLQTTDFAVEALPEMAAGPLPRMLAASLCLAALSWSLRSYFKNEPLNLPRINWRVPICISLSLVLFVVLLEIRRLLFAIPAATFVSSFVSREARLREALLFALVMTAPCILLARYVLQLPVPVIANYW